MTTSVTSRKRVRRASSTSELEKRLQAAADLQRQIQALELEQQGHRDWLLRHLQEHEKQSVTLGQFTAGLRVRHNWDYSPSLQREMLRIKAEQKIEQLSGTAVDTPKEYVSFTFKAA